MTRNVFRVGAIGAALLLCAVVMPIAARAQSGANSGQIIGQVTDPSGAAIPAAQVRVRNTETNYSRETVTDAAGRYTVLQAPLGPYEVTTRVEGFAPESQSVVVTLGTTITANLHLTVGEQTTAVQVIAQSTAVDMTHAPSKAILTALQLQHLPSNGGRLQTLVWSMPGGQVEPECRGLSVAGQKGIFANISVDGADYNSTFACGTGSIRGGSGSAPSFSMDALQEFQVTRNVFAAEFGRTTGGVINMSTKSGTNEFHHTASYSLRNDALSAHDVFGNQSVTSDHQFGGTVGGPIVKDRTFLFLAPQFQIASKPVSVLYTALDQQNLRATAGAQALLAIAPEQTISAFSDSQSIIGRIDHNLSNRNSMFGRFDFSHTAATAVTGSNGLSTGPSITALTTSAVSNQTVSDVWSGTALYQLSSTLGTNRLNELRVEFGREERPRFAQGTGPQVTVQNAGATIGTYGPQGTGISWGNGQFPSTDNRYQFADNFSIVSGAHTAKFGVDFMRIASHVTFSPGSNGVYTFSSLANFLTRTPSAYSQFTGTGDVSSAINEFGAFIQDDWRVGQNLTISPGFRYDAQFNPNYVAATLPQFRAPGSSSSIPNDLKQFQPRLGLAWNVGADGKTVVRAGAGVYDAPTVMSTFVQSILFNGANPELGYSVSTTNAAALASAFQAAGVNLSQAPLNNLPVFTAAQLYAGLGNPSGRLALNTNYIDPNFVNPRAFQWKVGLDRQLAPSLTAAIDYTHIHTIDITRQVDTNLPVPVADATGRLIYSAPRPLGSAFGVNQDTQSSAQAVYDAFTTSVNLRRPRYLLTAYYTLSWNKSATDTERPVSNIVYESLANLNNDYNWSNLDMRNQFTTTGVFFLPGAFTVSTNARALSGRPFSATVGSAGDLNKDGQTTDRPIADGVVVMRNTFRNSAFYNVDLRVERDFALPGQRGKITIALDLFNLFNFSNILIGSSNMAYGVGSTVQNGVVVPVAPPSTFGQLRDASGNYLLNNTPGDPFQAQIGLRWMF